MTLFIIFGNANRKQRLIELKSKERPKLIQWEIEDYGAAVITDNHGRMRVEL